MTRILGLDIGEKRIGVALSDPTKIIAKELVTIEFVEEKKAIEEIRKICLENDVDKMVIGIPFNLKGEVAHQAERVEKFVDELKKEIEGIEIIEEDERFTTKLARDFRKKIGFKKKEAIDSLAAVMILQNYLDRVNQDAGTRDFF